MENIFNIAKDEFIRLNEDERLEESKKIFEKICKEENQNLNEEKINSILLSLNKAITYNEEQYLYKLMYESERLNQQINEQKILIKTLLHKNIAVLKNTKTANENVMIDNVINNYLLKDLELLGILKETAEFAFVNVLEKNQDIEEISKEIAKNMTYNAILEGNLEKTRILKISKIILQTGNSVAKESKIYTKELILGIIKGTNDGIFKAISKFKDEFKYMPKEISKDLEQDTKELYSIESDFIALLKEISDNSDQPIKNIFLEVAKDSYLTQLKRISDQISIQIKDKLTQVSRLKDENMENLRKELAEFEKNASQKLTQIKNIQSFTKAKELGKRLYDAATNLIENAKK